MNISTANETKASVAKHFNRTFKTRMFRKGYEQLFTDEVFTIKGAYSQHSTGA